MRNTIGFTGSAIKSALFSTVALASLLGFAPAASADSVYIPLSSVETNGSVHTNVRMMIPAAGIGSLKPVVHPAGSSGLPPVAGYNYETPASLGCVYHLVGTLVAGCNPNATLTNPTGGSKVIAIVDAYDDPRAATDLANFSKQFGLPAANFSVVYASGRKPSMDSTGGWEIEESLDIEWAHAMAPGAQIILVEAASSNLGDLLTAVSKASSLVAAAGGGEVSMSWGMSEFSSETSYDSYFTTKNVVYVAAAGDSPGTEWPSVSPNVVSAGGTSTDRNPSTGVFEQENAWQVTGGGMSTYEARPSYQSAISTIVGTKRGVPDVAFDSDPSTGVWVLYDNNWYIVGGTSVAAPSLAGIINNAGKFNTSTSAELTQIYGGLGSAGFNDVSAGNCGPYAGYFSTTGWDLCTGAGSPLTNAKF